MQKIEGNNPIRWDSDDGEQLDGDGILRVFVICMFSRNIFKSILRFLYPVRMACIYWFPYLS
jgi:hypothetical protein